MGSFGDLVRNEFLLPCPPGLVFTWLRLPNPVVTATGKGKRVGRNMYHPWFSARTGTYHFRSTPRVGIQP